MPHGPARGRRNRADEPAGLRVIEVRIDESVSGLPERALELEHADDLEDQARRVDAEEVDGQDKTVDEHDDGGADEVFLGGPRDLVHFGFGGDQEVGERREVDDPADQPAQDRRRGDAGMPSRQSGRLVRRHVLVKLSRAPAATITPRPSAV